MRFSVQAESPVLEEPVHGPRHAWIKQEDLGVLAAGRGLPGASFGVTIATPQGEKEASGAGIRPLHGTLGAVGMEPTAWLYLCGPRTESASASASDGSVAWEKSGTRVVVSMVLSWSP